MNAVQSHHGDPNALTRFGSLLVAADAPGTIQTVLTPGNYVALNLTGNGPSANVAQFTVTQSPSPAALPAATATETAIEFGFNGPKVLHDGTMVRLENGGYLVHMDALVGARNKADAEKIIALLKAGKDHKAQKLATGFVDLMDPASPGAMQQEILNAKPGYYVQLLHRTYTEDGREHTHARHGARDPDRQVSDGEQAARLRSRGRRAGLLALAVMFSAGIHAALVPEHLQEMPPLGWSFVGAAAVGVALAWALVAYPEDRLFARLAALFLAVEVVVWVLFVSAAVPGFVGTPEPVETIALVCKAGELIGLWLAVAIGWPDGIAAWTASIKALEGRDHIRFAHRGYATLRSANTLTSAGTPDPNAGSSGPQLRPLARPRRGTLAPRRACRNGPRAAARRRPNSSPTATPSSPCRAPGPVVADAETGRVEPHSAGDLTSASAWRTARAAAPRPGGRPFPLEVLQRLLPRPRRPADALLSAARCELLKGLRSHRPIGAGALPAVRPPVLSVASTPRCGFVDRRGTRNPRISRRMQTTTIRAISTVLYYPREHAATAHADAS